ncbi:MAG: hypothetical protein CMJ49_01820 [Planctomycetaceae bacterium]|nr:hypothetical protein [Planctomycetaceae bacterium]
MPPELLIKAFVAGIVASIACGLGVLPLMFRRMDPARHRGLGYAFAGGLMFAASVYNLILPALQLPGLELPGPGEQSLPVIVLIVGGIMLGAMFLSTTDRHISRVTLHADKVDAWGGRVGILIFIAMAIHSIPEGVAVGVGYAAEYAEGVRGVFQDKAIGSYIAVAIAIHNIPEGLAVAVPMRSAGTSIPRCFGAAFLTSLPQPIAALPAAALAWLFDPIMPVLMGFAAGAMIFLILIGLIPEALRTHSARSIAWAFTIGFCLMVLMQVLI